MKFDRLRAKSGDGKNPSEYLPQHLTDALTAADAVLAATADDQLAALGLPPGDRDRLVRCVRLAAALHDIGKANDHTQGMLHGTRDVRVQPQGLRHEWASVLLIGHRLRDWLLTAADLTPADLTVIEWAVGGHHRELPPEPSAAPKGEGTELTILAGHPDFAAGLEVVRAAAGIPAVAPSLSDWTLPLTGGNRPADMLAGWLREAGLAWDRPRKRPAERRLAAAVKVCLIAADVAGSALPRNVPDPAQRAAWVPDAFAARPTADELATVAARRLDGHPPRPFQQAVADSDAPVTYVRAGCGSGKTVAAYLWAAGRRPVRRVYFCYPTTGTATEGFRDYLHVPEATDNDADDETVRRIRARLFHGRADVDLAMLTAAGDRPDDEAEAAARIESLDAWGTPVVSCTVDTVLGLMQNNRRGVYAWPALAGSAFVFDEIHAYDDRLFGALLRFLRDLPGLPALLMTASLPTGRKTALEACLAKAGRPLREVGGPKELEELPRYAWDRRRVTAAEAATAAAAELDRPDGKVLWVSNTVARAMAAADLLGRFAPDVYHSRFRYRDRVAQHGRVIGRFKGAGRAVACCTQVAEMSLDLSATLLVTDLAPVPALIQRLGRLNRRAKSEADPVRPFVVIDIGDDAPLPYSKEELQAARAWLDALPAGPLSQKDLADTWEAHDAAAWRPTGDDLDSAWLDYPETRVCELRKPSIGITVVMETDAAAVRSGQVKLAAVALPMPKPPAGWRSWPQVNGVPVAPAAAITYSPERGAEWAKS